MIFILLSGFTVFAETSCEYWKEVDQRTKRAVQKVEVIQKQTPVPNGFENKSSTKTIKFGYVTNFDTYRTTDDCESVGAYFRRHFVDQGWDPTLMTVEDTGGGMRTREFNYFKGEFRVTVECQIDVDARAEKAVVIGFNWRPR